MLNRRRAAACVLSSICLFILACKPAASLDPELEALGKKFHEANQAETIQPMRALYYLEGCDERTIILLETALVFELGLPIKEIGFQPLSGAPEETIDYIHQGVHYGPTLEPRYRMRVTYDVEDSFTSLFSVGQTEQGEWRIVSAKPLLETTR